MVYASQSPIDDVLGGFDPRNHALTGSSLVEGSSLTATHWRPSWRHPDSPCTSLYNLTVPNMPLTLTPITPLTLALALIPHPSSLALAPRCAVPPPSSPRCRPPPSAPPRAQRYARGPAPAAAALPQPGGEA